MESQYEEIVHKLGEELKQYKEMCKQLHWAYMQIRGTSMALVDDYQLLQEYEQLIQRI